MLRPNTTPAGSAFSRSEAARLAALTISSARRSARVIRPRLATAEVMVDDTASATTSATRDPPGESKCAAPSARAGKRVRTESTSNMALPDDRDRSVVELGAPAALGAEAWFRASGQRLPIEDDRALRTR